MQILVADSKSIRSSTGMILLSSLLAYCSSATSVLCKYCTIALQIFRCWLYLTAGLSLMNLFFLAVQLGCFLLVQRCWQYSVRSVLSLLILCSVCSQPVGDSENVFVYRVYQLPILIVAPTSQCRKGPFRSILLPGKFSWTHYDALRSLLPHFLSKES